MSRIFYSQYKYTRADAGVYFIYSKISKPSTANTSIFEVLVLSVAFHKDS